MINIEVTTIYEYVLQADKRSDCQLPWRSLRCLRSFSSMVCFFSPRDEMHLLTRLISIYCCLYASVWPLYGFPDHLLTCNKMQSPHLGWTPPLPSRSFLLCARLWTRIASVSLASISRLLRCVCVCVWMCWLRMDI